jgi:hypothetical protein
MYVDYQCMRDEIPTITAADFRVFAELLEQVKEKGLVVVL